MGGYSSTRWGFERTRTDTDGLLYLDATVLRKMGAFTPRALAWHEWTNGRGEPAGSIQSHMNSDGDALTLIYRIRENGGEWHDVRERIMLDATPCHYGGERPWLTCPGCFSRRRVLYSAGGRFRCRGCHDLAYSSTREDAQERSARRIRKLQKRLGAKRGDLYHIPPKPDGMHWETYHDIVEALLAEHDRQNAFFGARLDQLTKSVARLERDAGLA
jgi:hypothetical protein